MPKTRTGFWTQKLRRNRFRDLRNQRALKKLGWSFLILWECQLRDMHLLTRALGGFIKS